MTADEIKHLREVLDQTQAEFGELVGVSFATVNRWEKGRNQPHPIALRRLLDIRRQVEQQMQRRAPQGG